MYIICPIPKRYGEALEAVKCTRACGENGIRVDFHLAQNVPRARPFPFCVRGSRMEPSRNLFNFNNVVVARATFCTKSKSTFTRII